MDTSPDYRQIGRFIYGAARLEVEMAGLLRVMGQAAEQDPDLAASASEAQALFGRLPADDAVKAEFAALMHMVTAFAGQRDAVVDRFAQLRPEELAARNDELAAATQGVRRFRVIAAEQVRKA